MNELTLCTTDEAGWLFAQIREGFANAEVGIIEIVRLRAWEPLGYDNFADAWADRLKGLRVASIPLAAHIVYAFLDEGLTGPEVLLALGPSSGVGPSRVQAFIEQWASGVSPDQATGTLVRAHRREAPSRATYVHVAFDPDERAYFADLAQIRGLDLADEAAKAIRAHFRRLERVVDDEA